MTAKILVSSGMIRHAVFLMGLLASTLPCVAGTLYVGPELEYTTLGPALQAARAGDTVLLVAGIHAGGASAAGLHGRPDAWITIMGQGNATIEGGNNAFQLSAVSYVRIENLAIRGQTGNGINIDDAGDFSQPSHHIQVRNVAFGALNASGNNDQLKMSGVDSFLVSGCTFTDGSDGGSGIDMVGCHEGTIEHTRFVRQGSNSIQAKGGSRRVVIRWNGFENGGRRALNLGGSTGLEFFRPQNATYEAAELFVYGNIIRGSEAAIAFVGAVDVMIVHNTIVSPERWVLRILQETVDESRFQPCGRGVFMNNIVASYLPLATDVNIGPNTAPETFRYSHNLWYLPWDQDDTYPNMAYRGQGDVVGLDPRIDTGENAGSERFGVPAMGSPAIGAGDPLAEPLYDAWGRLYGIPPTIGARAHSGAATSVVDGTATEGIYHHTCVGPCHHTIRYFTTDGRMVQEPGTLGTVPCFRITYTTSGQAIRCEPVLLQP